jgi:hypothetical protein
MRYANLKGQQVHGVFPPRIQAMMSGCARAEQDNKGNITLVYEDGATETAAFPEKDIADFESFFAIVSQVQDRARHA